MLNKILVTCGSLLIIIVQQGTFDDGTKAALIFLGGSICLSVAFRVTLPMFDKIIADSCRTHYFKIHEQYVQSQQEILKRMEEEITNRKK